MRAHPVVMAYEAGYHSGVNGEDPRACPYPKMTAEWKAWHEAQRHGAAVHRIVAPELARLAELQAYGQSSLNPQPD